MPFPFQLAAIGTNDFVILLIILGIFSFFSFKTKSLTNSGIVFANIVGLIVLFLGGMQSFTALAVFYAFAEASTIFSRSQIKKKHEKRTTSNVIGNSGAALLALFAGNSLGFFGAIAAALSDTVSGEVGMLSKKNPRLITTFEEVAIGTDGGITTLGLLAGVLGAATIASVYFFFNLQARLFIIITVAGFMGTVVDSFLGAVFEKKGQLTKTQVNFLAGMASAIMAIALSIMF